MHIDDEIPQSALGQSAPPSPRTAGIPEVEPVPAARPHRVAPTSEAKTARRLLWLIPTTVIVLAVVTRLIVTSEAFSARVAAYIASDLSQRTQSTVQLSGVTFGYDFSPCFHDFEIFRFTGAYKLRASTKQACIETWASAVGSGFHAIRMRLEQPSIELEGRRDGPESRSLGASKPKTLTSTSAGARKAALREIQVVFDDLRVDWRDMPVPERFSTGTFGPIDGNVSVQIRRGQTAATFSIREPATGSSLNGRISPSGGEWDVSAGIEGDLVPIFGKLVNNAGFDIRKMPSRGRIGALVRPKNKTATIDLDLEQADLDVANELVSANRLVGFTARERARFSVDFERSELEMKDGLVEVNGIPLILSLHVRPGEASPLFDFRVDLRTTPLLRLLRSVPGAPEPVLTKELSSAVTFALSFSISGTLRDPATWQPKLDYRLTGVGPKGEGSGLELLRSTFRYYPLTREGRSPVGRIMGPGSPSWMPYNRIPYLQRRAVNVSEDAAFFIHHGIEIGEMQEAIKQGMATNEKTRGGSTITQQLVKNLFLTRDRTALRKIQEALLTFHLEASLSKEEIFELYMNIIEWGPEVYGIKEAAQHYFGKSVAALNPREMAYLATIIPGPILYHRHYEQGYVTARHNAKVDALLEKLNRLGNLPDDQYQLAKEYKLYFARKKKEPIKTPPPGEEEEGEDELEER